ncbi:MAG: CoA-binding protein [Gammaproteobacteria bacterium]|nr:CoA-binding protein [Gammaproteobacteria bacterium]
MTTFAEYQDPDTIQRVLKHTRNVAIVGLSNNELRASNFVGFYATRHAYNVIPVNPRETEIMGKKAYPSLLDVEQQVDVVNVFRDPSAVPEIAKQAVEIGAKALWLQFGVISHEGAEIAREAGMDVIMDLCFKIEHARYMGRMHWLGFNTGVITARRVPLG